MDNLSNYTVSITPQQFEAVVEDLLRKSGVGLAELRVRRLEKIDAPDGTYEIDVTARFEALGATFMVLIECKHYKHPVKREVVQILYDKLRAVGGHKGMIFSTARFQKGAIEFAQVHGIALIHVSDGRMVYETKSFADPQTLVSPYVGWLVGLDAQGNESNQLVSGQDPSTVIAKFNEQPTPSKN